MSDEGDSFTIETVLMMRLYILSRILLISIVLKHLILICGLKRTRLQWIIGVRPEKDHYTPWQLIIVAVIDCVQSLLRPRGPEVLIYPDEYVFLYQLQSLLASLCYVMAMTDGFGQVPSIFRMLCQC